MSINVFGGGPADVTTDANGNVAGGVSLKVYTAALGGQRVTELYDLNGDPLAGVVVSGTTGEDEGRVVFQASDQYQLLFLDAGYGMRWAVPAREAFSAAYMALGQSKAAMEASQEAQQIATESGVKADLAKAEVDAKLGFDITSLTPEYVTQLRVDPVRVAQSFAKDPMTGEYYVSQNRSDIGSTTNLVIYRCSPDGRVISECTFEGGGHGSTTAIERDGNTVWLWFRWTYDSTGSGFSNRMVRAKYQPGKVVKRNDPEVLEVMDVSDDLLVNFDIDQAADRISLRMSLGDYKEHYSLYKLSDYKAGRNTPIAQVGPVQFETGDSYQGHCTIDDHLYISRGNAANGGQNTINRFNWDSGALIKINIDDVGRSMGAFPGGQNEVEGACIWRSPNGTPALLFGKSVGTGRYRQALVYAFNPPAGDNLNAETFRKLNKIQAGEVLITPSAANTPTSVDVQFDWEFDNPPIALVTANTTGPGNFVTGVSASDVTKQGMKVWLTRASTTPTSVYWRVEEG